MIPLLLRLLLGRDDNLLTSEQACSFVLYVINKKSRNHLMIFNQSSNVKLVFVKAITIHTSIHLVYNEPYSDAVQVITFVRLPEISRLCFLVRRLV